MNDQAREGLGRVIKTYGPSICNIPRSCELFVRQECAPYPNESRVLIEALRHGITTELVGYNPKDRPWDAFTGQLRNTLKSRAGLNEVEGTWAVESWARALGRHPDDWNAAPEVVAASAPPPATVSLATLKRAMLLIVTSGGALGGFAGAIFVPGVMLATSAATDLPMMKEILGAEQTRVFWLVMLVVLAIFGSAGALGGAIGAALGWLHGRGDRAPWTGFSAACGAAFTSAALSGYFCGIFGWFIGSMMGAFGGARTAASRGGYG